MLRLLKCLLMPHWPDRRRVKRAGDSDYYGYCHSCGARIGRLKRGRWVRARHWPSTAPD